MQETLYLVPLFLLFLILVVVFIYVPRVILFEKILKNNKGISKTIFGKLVSISLVNELLISLKFSHDEKVYYLKVKILVDDQIKDYFISLINEKASCNHYKVRKITKEINDLFSKKEYSFNIYDGLIIDSNPKLKNIIVKRINSLS